MAPKWAARGLGLLIAQFQGIFRLCRSTYVLATDSSPRISDVDPCCGRSSHKKFAHNEFEIGIDVAIALAIGLASIVHPRVIRLIDRIFLPECGALPPLLRGLQASTMVSAIWRARADRSDFRALGFSFR